MTLNNWNMIAETRSYIFMMTFWPLSTSCLLKLRIVGLHRGLDENKEARSLLGRYMKLGNQFSIKLPKLAVLNLGPPKTKSQLFLCKWAKLASSSLSVHSKLLRKQWILFEPGITCSWTHWNVRLFETLYFTFYQLQWNIKPFLTRNLTLKKIRDVLSLSPSCSAKRLANVFTLTLEFRFRYGNQIILISLLDLMLEAIFWPDVWFQVQYLFSRSPSVQLM